MGKILFGTAIVMWIFGLIHGGLLFVIIAGFILYSFLTKKKKANQKNFLENYQFPKSLDKKILSIYPHLSNDDLTLVKRELKNYFKIKNIYKPKIFAMPSRVVDVAWHEFILHTRDYDWFCKQAFGHYFHHNPFSKEMSSKDMTESLQRTWVYSCKAERIRPNAPYCLPVLFSIDSALNIPDGNVFSVENMNDSMDNDFRNSHDSLKCVSGAFVGLGAVTLVIGVDVVGNLDVGAAVSGGDGGSGGGGGGGDGGCGCG